MGYKYVYAQDLVALREKEAQLMKNQMDGLDIYAEATEEKKQETFEHLAATMGVF